MTTFLVRKGQKESNSYFQLEYTPVDLYSSEEKPQTRSGPPPANYYINKGHHCDISQLMD